MRLSRRPVTLVVAGVAVTVVGMLGVIAIAIEVEVAGRGLKLDEFDPSTIDGVVEPDGAQGEPVRVVWLGDSTAAGVGASGPAGSLAVQVAHISSRPSRIAVRAVSGARIADVERQVPGIDPAAQVVFVSAGANDATHLTDLHAFAESYDRVLAALPDGATVVVLGVPALGTATRLAQPLRRLAGMQGSRYDDVVREVAARHGATYVDIAGTTGPAFAAEPDRYLTADHYHPSDAGYSLWRDAIVPSLPPVLA